MAEQQPQRYKGLPNLGNTCYLSSVLQALYACEPFYAYVIPYRGTQRLPLHRTLAVLFYTMRPNDPPIIGGLRQALENFINAFQEVIRLRTGYANEFARGGQHDCHEFYIHLLQHLLTEINGLGYDYRVPGFAVAGSTEHAWHIFENAFPQNRQLLDMFFALELRQSIYDWCGHSSNAWAPIQFCTLPVAKRQAVEREYSVQRYIHNLYEYQNDYDVTLQCVLTPQCVRRGGWLRFSFARLPQVFAIHLLVFTRHNKVLNHYTVINQYLTVEIYRNRMPSTFINYRLFAVISHFGNTSNSGHYITSRRHENQWIQFDDRIVTDNISSAQLCVNLENAYVLFYERFTPNAVEMLSINQFTEFENQQLDHLRRRCMAINIAVDFEASTSSSNAQINITASVTDTQEQQSGESTSGSEQQEEEDTGEGTLQQTNKRPISGSDKPSKKRKSGAEMGVTDARQQQSGASPAGGQQQEYAGEGTSQQTQEGEEEEEEEEGSGDETSQQTEYDKLGLNRMKISYSKHSFEKSDVFYREKTGDYIEEQYVVRIRKEFDPLKVTGIKQKAESEKRVKKRTLSKEQQLSIDRRDKKRYPLTKDNMPENEYYFERSVEQRVCETYEDECDWYMFLVNVMYAITNGSTRVRHQFQLFHYSSKTITDAGNYLYTSYDNVLLVHTVKRHKNLEKLVFSVSNKVNSVIPFIHRNAHTNQDEIMCGVFIEESQPQQPQQPQQQQQQQQQEPGRRFWWRYYSPERTSVGFSEFSEWNAKHDEWLTRGKKQKYFGIFLLKNARLVMIDGGREFECNYTLFLENTFIAIMGELRVYFGMSAMTNYHDLAFLVSTHQSPVPENPILFLEAIQADNDSALWLIEIDKIAAIRVRRAYLNVPQTNDLQRIGYKKWDDGLNYVRHAQSVKDWDTMLRYDNDRPLPELYPNYAQPDDYPEVNHFEWDGEVLRYIE